MLYNRPLHRLGQVGVVVCNDARLVANAVVDILDAALAQKLVALLEGNLDDAAELGELLGCVVLDVGDTLKVRNELLGDVLPTCAGEM